jgi:type I restriction enzyme, R subunit
MRFWFVLVQEPKFARHCACVEEVASNRDHYVATFAGTGDDGTEGSLDPTRPNDELLGDLKEAIAAARRFLTDRGVDLDAIIQSTGFERNAALVRIKEAINTNDEARKRFEILAREVFSKFKSCLTLKGVNNCRADSSALGLIYKSLQKDREAADISGIMQQLHQVVDAAIVPRGGETPVTGKLFDISAIDFDRLRAEFERSPAKRTTVINLMDAIEKRLARLMAENPTRTNFQARYEEMVTEYNEEKDRVTIEATFQSLLKFVAALGEEESRAFREGLDPEALTLFDLLKKPDLKRAEIERLPTLQSAPSGRAKTRSLAVKLPTPPGRSMQAGRTSSAADKSEAPQPSTVIPWSCSPGR